jgi:RNA polymerase sigma-70 factor (ECF subfamily)
MYHVARNAQIDHFRKQKHTDETYRESEEDVFSDVASPGLTPEEQLAKRQETHLVRKALSQLPLERREVLILSRYQGFKYEEIATILGCEIGTVKGRVFRAIRELADVFNGITGEKAE